MINAVKGSDGSFFSRLFGIKSSAPLVSKVDISEEYIAETTSSAPVQKQATVPSVARSGKSNKEEPEQPPSTVETPLTDQTSVITTRRRFLERIGEPSSDSESQISSEQRTKSVPGQNSAPKTPSTKALPIKPEAPSPQVDAPKKDSLATPRSDSLPKKSKTILPSVSLSTDSDKTDVYNPSEDEFSEWLLPEPVAKTVLEKSGISSTASAVSSSSSSGSSSSSSLGRLEKSTGIRPVSQGNPKDFSLAGVKKIPELSSKEVRKLLLAKAQEITGKEFDERTLTKGMSDKLKILEKTHEKILSLSGYRYMESMQLDIDQNINVYLQRTIEGRRVFALGNGKNGIAFYFDSFRQATEMLKQS